MSVIYWKLINPLFQFKHVSLDPNKYVVKVINTNQLVTKYSSNIVLNGKIQIRVHTSEVSPEVVIGYEILNKSYFKLKIIGNNYLLFGTNNIKQCNPKKIYENFHFTVFRSNINNFLCLVNE